MKTIVLLLQIGFLVGITVYLGILSLRLLKRSVLTSSCCWACLMAFAGLIIGGILRITISDPPSWLMTGITFYLECLLMAAYLFALSRRHLHTLGQLLQK